MSEFIKSDEIIGSKADREMDKFWLQYKEKLESARWQEHYNKNIAPFVPPPRRMSILEDLMPLIALVVIVASVLALIFKPWR